MGSSPSEGFAKLMTGTYTAVEAFAPGQHGICHTDSYTIAGSYPGLTLPRVPGHEVVGRIDALGFGVSRWKIGQRVGVGLIAGEDGVCEPCRRGDAVNCQNAVVSGVNADGGYAEVMVAEAHGITSIPDELSSAEAAPRGLRLTMPFATLACGLEIWSLCKASVASGISVFSLRARWHSVLLRLGAVPLAKAAEAYVRMIEGEARFRMVLVTKNGAAIGITVES